MSTLIRKSPEIQGKVFFLQANEQEREVTEEFTEFIIQGPLSTEQQVLTFLEGDGLQFIPDGVENAFKNGVEYTLIYLMDNQLTIVGSDGYEPRWKMIEQ